MTDRAGTRALLARTLKRVRVRMRAQRGLEGAVWGAVIGGAAVLAVAVLRGALGGTARGLVLPPGWWAAGVVPIAAGVVVGLARSIPLERCARALDVAVARRGGRERDRNGDRAFVALGLMQRPADDQASVWIEAAVRDAVRSAREASPGVAAMAAPVRPPRGSWAALGLVAAAVLAVVLPARPVPAGTAAGARSRSTVAPDEPKEKLDARSLAAELEAAREAQRRARALGDDVLGRLAARLGEVLRELGGAGVGHKALEERLSALAQEATETAAGGESLRRGLDAAGEALTKNPQADAVGKALQDLDEAATKSRLEAMAESAQKLSAAARQEVADTLASAAAAARATPVEKESQAALGPAGRRGLMPSLSAGAEERKAEGGAQSESRTPEQRRLDREAGEDSARAGARDGRGERQSARGERELKRLERELDEAADRCRQDPAACAEALRRAAEQLSRDVNEAQQSGARQKLAETVEQLRERMRREQAGAPREGASESRFEEAAGGGAPGREPGQSGNTQAGEASRPSGGAEATATAPGGEGPPVATTAAGNSERPGTEPGDSPLGERTGLTGRGREVRAQVGVSGEGPSRATVIEGGAREGFRSPAYQRVWNDYEAASEEVLDATAVPPGRRYIVRRYFQLIRPRK